MTRIVAFDLDGTLCNIEHRLHYIHGPKKDWPAFFDACVDDKPVWPLIEVCKQLMYNPVFEVEIWSGRSDRVARQTKAWLGNHGLAGRRKLRMRKDGDYRQDCIVKAEWFDALGPEDRPELAFDDRQQVVDMWRSRGVICAQVAPGNF